MSFEQYAAKVKKLVNDCDIEDTEAKNIIIWNFLVTSVNSQAAYRQCIEAGPNANWDRILEIYRNDAKLGTHMVSELETELPSPQS